MIAFDAIDSSLLQRARELIPDKQAKRREYQRARYARNIEAERERSRIKNRKRIYDPVKAKEYRTRSYAKPHIRAGYIRRANEWSPNRRVKYQSDPLYRMKCCLRSRMTAIFTKRVGWKTDAARKLIGADWETVKARIESTFKDGMTWESHGRWHIDHIKPLAKATTPEELAECCHYTNLQALWALDNHKKSARYGD